MINSMTGYGGAEGQLDGITYAVEIRTVNNRYFKARIKLPDSMAFLEGDIEKLLRKDLLRGMVDYVLRLKNASANVLFDIDEAALRAVMGRLGSIASSIDIKCPIDIGGLLALPGILVPISPDEAEAGQVKGKVLSITAEAIDQLKQMRATEGAALAADLDSHCKAIKQDLEQIRTRSAGSPAEYATKLKKRVDEMLADVKLKLDQQTLAREVAIFAERTDISEELARLDSHLKQFNMVCQEGDLPGRRLDFISQEMLREANTIASKTENTEITYWVVDIKCRINRIKEQVQNIV